MYVFVRTFVLFVISRFHFDRYWYSRVYWWKESRTCIRKNVIRELSKCVAPPGILFIFTRNYDLYTVALLVITF